MIVVLYTYISESSHNRLLEKLSFFSDRFQQKVLKYRKWEDAQLSLLGRLLLKEGLENYFNSDYIDSDVEYMQYAKPYFKSKKYHFNISHSGNIAVCAISEKKDIGIDIEMIKSIDVEHFKNQMTNYELNKIEEGVKMNLERFYSYWTEKEAVIKSNSRGLHIPLKSFEIKSNKTTIDNEVYYVKELKIDSDYKCNIAFKKKDKCCSEHNDTYKLIHFKF
ncbi:4'-phosphopantetheinyl transferase superfamily protein [Tenacibaculum tangerinum]|uniref:4'-phosphopantetheinyl transferase superfamily protein n=1 Tax=Tenacibaculum tangerinum TaxID=3038772 RepID=A0ABY8L2K7_9FLAO|nr:4'-phosphopantetheinyl transferase superfamily protein [Tenacibaculum tangerinum]WGH74219.1 4'-phosphopantetheinyl transferase superfamily protein [Tenacibaculum tangerinum]